MHCKATKRSWCNFKEQSLISINVFYAYMLINTKVVIFRYADEMATSSLLIEVAYFLTTGIVISAFALPIILSRSPKDNPVVHRVL